MNRLYHLSSPAAILGGILWMLHETFFFSYGLAKHEILLEASDPLWASLAAMIFFGAYWVIGIALLGIYAHLRGTQKILGKIGATLACLACLAGVMGFISGLITFLTPLDVLTLVGVAGPVGIFSIFLSAIMLSIAHFRQHILPHYIAVILLLFGLLTMPLGFLLSQFDQGNLLYFFSEFHFLIAGVLWVIMGLGIRKAPLVAYASSWETVRE